MFILTPEPEILSSLWPSHEITLSDDFLIFLRDPVLKHYKGSVFRLGEASGFSGWEEDSRLREKLNFSDQRIYNLPDSGRGIPTTLSKSMTSPLPGHLWQFKDVFSGPWRITSMSKQEVAKKHSYDVLPLGKPPFLVRKDEGAHLYFEPFNATERYQLTITETLTSIPVIQMSITGLTCCCPVHSWPPGFYHFNVENDFGTSWYTTTIKMFPFYVETLQNGTLELLPTQW